MTLPVNLTVAEIVNNMADEKISVAYPAVGDAALDPAGQIGSSRNLGGSPLSGETSRVPRKIIARWPGHMVHIDMKKVGRTPEGGGWRIRGRDSDESRAVARAKTAGTERGSRPAAGSAPSEDRHQPRPSYNYQAISPVRSTKRPDPAPDLSVARPTIASVPSVTVWGPLWPLRSVAV